MIQSLPQEARRGTIVQKISPRPVMQVLFTFIHCVNYISSTKKQRQAVYQPSAASNMIYVEVIYNLQQAKQFTQVLFLFILKKIINYDNLKSLTIKLKAENKSGKNNDNLLSNLNKTEQLFLKMILYGYIKQF